VYVPDRDHTLDELRTLRAWLPASVPVVAGGAGATQLAPELTQRGIRVGARLADLSAVLEDAVNEDAA
jgi:hypothetical protein